MSNLSKKRRLEMVEFLNKLREEHIDDTSTIAINEIENFINEKKYGLVWEEHSEHVDEEMIKNIPVFKENEDKKIIANVEENFNFLLEGDNLHSLKLLEKTHKGKIDLIYIDPPYNRGKGDFIYDDNYIVTDDTFKHSKWLSFMEKRLKIARNLLKETGLIFISIDDNEVSQLKMLCDEIFSEVNFVNKFVWQRNSSVKTEIDKFTVNTEYVLLYTKSRNFKLNAAFKPLADTSIKMFNKNDGDGRGKYSTVSLQKPRDPGPETTYDYVDNTGKVWKCPPKGWRMTCEKLKALENDGRLYFKGIRPREKKYWNEREDEGKRIDTLWNDIAENTTGSKELEKVLGKKNMFDNPKPTELIERCLMIGDKNACILDFFAGSGTTGQAVMQLNKKDDGNRNYILCTNNENNICEEVTYQRLKNIQEDFPHNLKFFKTQFITKLSDDEDIISDRLLNHIKEMVELENMCEVDGEKHILILSENDMEISMANKLKDCAKIYLPSYILLDREHENLIKNKGIVVIDIPDYYFIDELREVGEI